jgi:signal transduction histidine kinase
MFQKIKNFFSTKESLIFTISLLLFIILLLTLFVSIFNLLKILVFIGLILSLFILILTIQLLKKPKEKISSFFSFLQNLLDNLQEGIVIYDDEFKIIFANNSFCDLVNLKKNELIDLLVKNEMIKSKKYQMLANIFFPFLQGEDLKIISETPEIIEVKFNEPKLIYLLIGYVDIYLDKKYKLRIVLDKTRDVLESQQRLEFIQMVGHSLLTPLSELRWSLEAIDLKEVSEENKKLIESSLRIIKSTIVFAELVLTLVQTEIGKFKLKIEEVDLEKIFVFILNILKEKIEEKKLKVNVEIEETVTKIKADERVLSLSLFTIIENAVLYNKVGGSIFIKVQKMSGRPYLEIKIEDTGVGMTKEDLANLFKKYYRGKKAKELDVKGFGIGLYNAKKIINFHGGDISVESEENKGTKVTIALPLDPSLIPGL